MLTKRELNALEKIWIAEVDDTLPLQSNAKVYAELEREGLVQRGEEHLLGDIPMVIRGWYLTHAGRLAYCMTCEDEP